MINTGVIGCGNWGKKIIKILKKKTNLIFVANSNSNYQKKLKKVDWVFIATPDKTHFKIAKFLIKKKKIFFAKNL